MRRVAFAFETLEPAAVLNGLGDVQVIRRKIHPLIIGQQGNAYPSVRDSSTQSPPLLCTDKRL